MKEGREEIYVCAYILKKKTPHTNQHHPHQPIAHPSLFSKTKQLAACRANSQVPRAEFFLHLWQQASIFVIALDSSNPDPPKGQNTSNPGISCDKISREIVRLENHGQDYCYLTGCESESSSSGRVVNAFHMPQATGNEPRPVFMKSQHLAFLQSTPWKSRLLRLYPGKRGVKSSKTQK